MSVVSIHSLARRIYSPDTTPGSKLSKVERDPKEYLYTSWGDSWKDVVRYALPKDCYVMRNAELSNIMLRSKAMAFMLDSFWKDALGAIGHVGTPPTFKPNIIECNQTEALDQASIALNCRIADVRLVTYKSEGVGQDISCNLFSDVVHEPGEDTAFVLAVDWNTNFLPFVEACSYDDYDMGLILFTSRIALLKVASSAKKTPEPPRRTGGGFEFL